MYPRLIELGPFSLPTYGVFAALALILGLMLAMRTAQRLRVAPDAIWNFGLISILSAVVGAKLLLVMSHWHDFVSYPVMMLSLSIRDSVTIVLTRLGIAIFAGLLYLTLKRLPWLRTFDAVAPAMALGEAILMLGCFFAGCDYGRPTAVPWGVNFHSRWAALWNGTPLNISLHPVQLYLSGVELILCALLLWWLPRRRQDGELAGAWLFLSGLAQFFLDFYRGDNRLLVLDGAISITQVVAFAMALLGALFLLPRPQDNLASQTLRSQA